MYNLWIIINEFYRLACTTTTNITMDLYRRLPTDWLRRPQLPQSVEQGRVAQTLLGRVWRHKTVLSCPCRWCEQNWRQVKTVADRKIRKLFGPVLKCGVNRVLSCFQLATRTWQKRSHRRSDWTKLFSLQYPYWGLRENSLGLLPLLFTLLTR